MTVAIDNAMAPCLQNFFHGDGFATIAINEYKQTASPTPQPFCIVTLTKAFIESFALSSGGAITYSLAYHEIKIEYRKQKDDGSLEASSDIQFNVYESKRK